MSTERSQKAAKDLLEIVETYPSDENSRDWHSWSVLDYRRKLIELGRAIAGQTMMDTVVSALRESGLRVPQEEAPPQVESRH